MKTYSAKPSEVERRWWLIDASDAVLGRLAVIAAMRLRGKHKPTYTPHIDCGDHVVVVNAEKVALTGRKLETKMYRRHSGYPGGLREIPAGEVLKKQPVRLVESAVRGMLPKGPLGRQMVRKLKVYAGSTHPHEAQQPQALELPGAARQR